MRSRNPSILAAESDNYTPTGVGFRAFNASEAIRSPDRWLPLVIEPESSEELAPLLEWISANTSLLHQLLLQQILAGKSSPVEDAARERMNAPTISSKAAYRLARAYWKNAVVFTWKEGDILVLDNRLVAHGRMPFRGERSVLACVTQATLPKSTSERTRIPR